MKASFSGWGVQWNENGGRCGICGDPWQDFPREHEAPLGKFATGIKQIVAETIFSVAIAT